jgi:hypothetical protein
MLLANAADTDMLAASIRSARCSLQPRWVDGVGDYPRTAAAVSIDHTVINAR